MLQASILVFALYQISDIKTTRIDYMLKEISETLLCDLPERNPWGVTEFLQKMEVQCIHNLIINIMQNLSSFYRSFPQVNFNNPCPSPLNSISGIIIADILNACNNVGIENYIEGIY